MKYTMSTFIMFQTIQMIDSKDMFHLSLKGHKQVASLLLIYFRIEHRLKINIFKEEQTVKPPASVNPQVSDKN